MRILHILDHSLPQQSGYVFRTLGILDAQRAQGWETIQLTSPKHRAPYTPTETVDGWEFHRTPEPTTLCAKLPGLQHLAVINATANRLETLVARVRPDVLHAHSPVLNALAALRIGRRLGLPVVYEVRALWEDAAADQGKANAAGPWYRVAKYIETMALQRVQAVTTISEGLLRDLVQRGIAPEKITVVPNAVDTEQFSPARDTGSRAQTNSDNSAGAVLGYLGSFFGYEGLDFLIEALPEVLRQQPQTKLLLVGGGPEEARLKAIAGKLGLETVVEFAGRVPHEQIQQYYNLIDILVFPRRSSRLTELVTPLKPLEAMAQELIVLASDVGGHRELIDDGRTGYLFKAGDKEDFIRRLLMVMDERGTWPGIGAAARESVVAERTWKATVARYQEVYARALAAH